MDDCINTCLSILKTYSKALIDFNCGVIGTHFDGTLLKVQFLNKENLLNLNINSPISENPFEYLGERWVRYSCMWKGIELFCVIPSKGGE